MKRKLIYPLLTILFFILHFSCQQEIGFGDQPSSGSLNKNASGDCLPINIAGTYISGKAVGDTNSMVVEVSVTTAGTYFIYTDTLNGYSFSASGSFSGTGNYQVSLKASGTPLTNGVNHFTVMYDSSICQATVNVIPGGAPALFTLQGSSGACMDAVITGTYVKDIPLDTSAKVIAGVIVAIPGSYNITTNTVNGYHFSATGSFLTTGPQTITLKGSGTPIATGTNIFTLATTTSSCTFPVSVLVPTIVNNDDYFPLTSNSYWVYDDIFRAGDSLKRTITTTTTLAGNIYTIMQEQPMNGPPLLYNFRKAGFDYYEYGLADKYTNSFQYAVPMDAQLRFLSQLLNTGDAWQSDEFSALANFGQVIKLRYQFACVNANATATVNGNAFSNVYKIVMRPEIRSEDHGYGSTGEIYTYYYAKGIGLIYAKKTRDNFTLYELLLRRWQVN